MKTLKMIAVFLAVLAAMSFAKKIPVEAHVYGGGATVSVASQFELGKSFTAMVTPINGYAINAVYIEANYEGIDSTGQVIESDVSECSQTATNVWTCEVPDYPVSYISIDFWVSTYELTSYSITNNSASGTYGYLSAPSSALENDYVQLTPKITNNGYEVDYVWYCEAASSTTCSGTQTKVSLKDGKYYFPMPTYNVLVGVEFKQINYTIAKSCGAKGSLDAPSTGKMNESITFSLEPNKGYKVKSVSVTKNSGGTIKPSCNADSSSCSFTMPAEAVKITAEFEPRVYTITYESAEHVRFTLAPTEWTAHTVFTVSWEVDAGYDAYIDAYAYEDHSSLNVVLLQPPIVKYAMPSCNVKVEVVNVRLKEYKISTPDVNGKGTAALSKTSGIHYDDEIVLTLTPGEGYEVSQIDIQSASSTVEEIEAATDENPLQYSLKKVAENQYSFRMPDYEIDNISVTFKAIEYNVTIGYAEHGDIAILTSATKSIDEEVLFAVEPHEGYEIDFFEVVRKDTDEEIATSNEGSKYTFVMPASDVFVSGGFKAIAASSSSETESSSSEGVSSSSVESSSSESESSSGVESSDSKFSSSSTKITSSSSAKSSSSSVKAKSSSSKKDDGKSSSSSAKAKSSSSSAKAKSSSSKGSKDAIVAMAQLSQFSVTTIGRDVQIAGARVGDAYAILDMQGRVINSGRVESANFGLPVARAGSYMLRIGHETKAVSVK